MQAQMQNSGQHIVGVQSPLATLTNSYVRKKPRPWLTPTSASHSSQHTSEALPADMATREPHVLHTPPPSAHRLLGGLSPPHYAVWLLNLPATAPPAGNSLSHPTTPIFNLTWPTLVILQVSTQMSPPPRSLPGSPQVGVGPSLCVTPVPLTTSVQPGPPSHEQGTPPVLFSTVPLVPAQGGVPPSLCIINRAPRGSTPHWGPKRLTALAVAASLTPSSPSTPRPTSRSTPVHTSSSLVPPQKLVPPA